MLALFFFGPMVESYLGARRFTVYYLICGISGAAAYVFLSMLHVLISGPWVPLVGASAGIFGVLIAAAEVAPDATILIYGIIPMRLRVGAWLFLAYAGYTVLTQGNNAGGEAAHIGGALVGYGLMHAPRILNVFDPPRRRQS
jgi:membrane associated rhomboid family serine protease